MGLMLNDFFGALGLLTVIPVPRAFWVGQDWSAGRALVWFPLVGWIVGALVAGCANVLSLIFPLPLVAILTLTVWIWLTGALHLDGVIDSCDGLCAMVNPERRLEIMKDPRAGSFGVIGVLIVVLLKGAAIFSLSPERRGIALLLIPVIARVLIRHPMLAYPSARTGGLGNAYRSGSGSARWMSLWLIPLVLIPISGVWVAGGVVFVVLFSRWASNRLGGGLTGDVYGATLELTETLCLILACAG
jgi:adenosylcobinamide-GDP ribazoletransferase